MVYAGCGPSSTSPSASRGSLEGWPMTANLHLEVLEHTPLTAVVRRALGEDRVELVTWNAAQIHGGIGAASGGVYRFTGTARTAGTDPRTERRCSWSLVLKVLRAPAA